MLYASLDSENSGKHCERYEMILFIVKWLKCTKLVKNFLL